MREASETIDRRSQTLFDWKEAQEKKFEQYGWTFDEDAIRAAEKAFIDEGLLPLPQEEEMSGYDKNERRRHLKDNELQAKRDVESGLFPAWQEFKRLYDGYVAKSKEISDQFMAAKKRAAEGLGAGAEEELGKI